MIDMTRGRWQPESANWTYCDPDQNQGDNPWSSSTALLEHLCPKEWALAMNQLDCAIVWKDYDATRDYSLEYFEKVTGPENEFLVQRLIAQSGVRMAAILNEIYDRPTQESESKTHHCGEQVSHEVPVPESVRFVKQGPRRLDN